MGAADRRARVAAVFRRYDTDRDGRLSQHDVARLERETAGEDVDDEAWATLCEIVGATDDGWGVSELERLYGMEGGEEELSKAKQASPAVPAPATPAAGRGPSSRAGPRRR